MKTLPRLKILSVLFLFTCLSPVFAQATPAEPFTPAEEWTKTLADINTQITTSPWTLDKANETIHVIQGLQNQAEVCVKETERSLGQLNGATGTAAAAAPENNDGLSKNTLQLNYQKMQCQLFIFHSQRVLTQIEKIQQQLEESALFVRNPSILTTSINLANTSYHPPLFSFPNFYKNLGFSYFDLSNFLIFVMMTFFGLLVGYSLQRLSLKSLHTKTKDSLWSGSLQTIHRLAYWGSLSAIYTLFFGFISEPNFTIGLAKISFGLLLLIFAFSLVQVVLYPPKGARPLAYLDRRQAFSLTKRVSSTFSFIFFAYLLSLLLRWQNFPPAIYALGLTVFVTVLCGLLASIVLAITMPLKRSRNYLFLLINFIFLTPLACIVALNWMGYTYFSQFLLKNTIITFVLTFLAWSLCSFLLQILAYLERKERVRHYLGLSSPKKIPEFFLLKILIVALVWGGLILSLLNIWVLSEIYFDMLINALAYGFNLGSLHVEPTRLLFALLLFIGLCFITRFLQVLISRQHKVYLQEGAQVALATVAGYFGFTTALILSLVIAGVNFTGLAIVAGALSVGIGFGLQNIINNFICGLILLIEAPIHPGDHIMVGEVEGVVKRINLRATQVITPRGSDTFIPNAELISKNVTNFMYQDTAWTVVCKVGVSYHADMDLVKKTLLEVALEHPQVAKEAPNLPKVYVNSLGDNAIQVSLHCIIEHVHYRSTVESELYTAILKHFSAKNISIPYPQRDVHLSPQTDTPHE